MKKLFYIFNILLLTGCFFVKKQPLQYTIEFRLAETEYDIELEEATMKGTDEVFYLHQDVLMNNNDIKDASYTLWQDRPSVELIFTESGRKKFSEITNENISRRLGILINDELVTVPIIMDHITEGRAIINGIFTEEEARNIAEALKIKDPGFFFEKFE